MSDLISRQAAIDALKDAENHAFNSYYKGLIKAHKIIADLPSVEAEPRKHGRWIHVFDSEPYDEYVCSVCGTRASSFIGGTEMWYCLLKPNYCPNCGAKMDEVEE